MGAVHGGAGDGEGGAAFGGEFFDQRKAEAHALGFFFVEVGAVEGADAFDFLGGHAAAGVADGEEAVFIELDLDGGAAAGVVAGVVDEFLDDDAEVGVGGDDGGVLDFDGDVLGALGADAGGFDAGLDGFADFTGEEELDEAAFLLGGGGEIEEEEVIAEAAVEAVGGGIHVLEDAFHFVGGEFAEIGAEDLDEADDAAEGREEAVGDGGVEGGAELRQHAVLDVGADVGALEAGGDAFDEGLDADGLGEEIVGALFHAFAGSDGLGVAGHEDDLLVAEVGVGADVFEEGLAVAAGHGDVGEDEIGELLAGEGVAGVAGVGLEDAVAFVAEDGAEDGADVGVVVDQENRMHSLLRFCIAVEGRGRQACSRGEFQGRPWTGWDVGYIMEAAR